MRTRPSLESRLTGALACATLLALTAGSGNSAPQPGDSPLPSRAARAAEGVARSTGILEEGRSELRFLGRIRWEAIESAMEVSIDRLVNTSTNSSRMLKLELWLLPRPFKGEEQRGWLLDEQNLGALQPEEDHRNLEFSGRLDAAPPGDRYAALLVRERVAGGWVLRAYRDLGAVSVPGKPVRAAEQPARSEPERKMPAAPDNPERPRPELVGSGAKPVPMFAPNRQEQQLSTMLTEAAGQKRKSLSPNPILAKVARERALDMARRGYFDHINPDGEGPNHLASLAGYRLAAIYGKARNGNNIESIGAGPETAQEAWELWMNSQGHKTHLLGLEPFYQDQTEYGVGYASDPESPYRHYWVVLIAKPAS